MINVTNSLHCKFCLSKFRVRVAATSLLNRVCEGRFSNINRLIKQIGKKNVSLRILETSGADGIFSGYTNFDNIIKSEFGTQLLGLKLGTSRSESFALTIRTLLNN